MGIPIHGLNQPNTILTKSGHRVTIDRGTFRAADSYRINPDWRVHNQAGQELVRSLYSDFAHHLRTRPDRPLSRISSGYIDAMSCVVANARNGMHRGQSIRYGRASNNDKKIREVVDYLEMRGMANNIIGKANEYQKNTSWFSPTDNFQLELERANVRVQLANNTPQIILRDADGKQQKFKQTVSTQKLGRSISAYNDMWLTHDATLDDTPVIPFGVRIFNGKWDYGGRIYRAGHLTMPKRDRARIMIDDRRTIEPDYSSLHFALLYALEGIELDTDPYMIDGFDRDTIKLASLILLNSDNLAGFKRNITKSGNPDVKAAVDAYKMAYSDYMQFRRNGIKCREPQKPDLAHGFIDGMPDGINGADLLEALINRHPLISHFFGLGKIGLKLQRIDSDIMSACLGALASLDVPALPVHDSIRCKISDVDIVVKIMRESYQSATGFVPKIDIS